MKKEKLGYRMVAGCQLPLASWCYKFFGFAPMMILGFSILMSPLMAQVEKTKSVEKEFNLNKNGEVKVDHRYGLLKVVESTDGKVHLHARMRVEGNNETDIQRALDQFEMDINEFGNQVTIETDLGIKNWNSRNGKTNLTFKNGAKVKGLKRFTAELLLSVPKLKKLTLKNKYEDILIDHSLGGDLEVILYDGDLKTKNIDGLFELNLKYGAAFLENLQDADMELYDSKLEMGKGNDLKISSKYSEYTLGDTENLKIKAYDDKMELGNISGQFEMTDKYSEVEMGNFGTAELDIYDADFNGKKGKKLSISGSKYSKYRFVEVDEIDIDVSYDDEFIFKKINNLEVTESKYTEYDLGSLSGHIGLLTSHDDQLEVDITEPTFKGLKINGKYTKIKLDIPAKVKYTLDVEMTYGNIDYPEEEFESQYYKEKSSVLEVRGKIKGASADAPKVEVKGYDCKIELE